jgi:putative flippase GtrA
MNSIWTYREALDLKKFILFPLSTLPGLVMSLFGLHILIDTFQISEMVAWYLGILIQSPISYVLSKKVIKEKVIDRKNEMLDIVEKTSI